MRTKKRTRSVLLILIGALAVSPGLQSAEPPLVLFDQSHGQLFLIDRPGPLHLSSLAEVVVENGLRVEANREPLTASRLVEIDALVISGPFQRLEESEVEAILGFVEAGGRLGVMLHIGPPLADLLHRLGVSISNGVIRERQGVLADNPLDFEVTRLAPHSLTDGISSFNIYGSWALLPTSPTAKTLAETGPRAWVDLNGNQSYDHADATQAFAVIVTGSRGNGRFVVFGDDAIFQNRLIERGNRRLAGNLARWLKPGDLDAGVVTASDPGGIRIGPARGSSMGSGQEPASPKQEYALKGQR